MLVKYSDTALNDAYMAGIEAASNAVLDYNGVKALPSFFKKVYSVEDSAIKFFRPIPNMLFQLEGLITDKLDEKFHVVIAADATEPKWAYPTLMVVKGTLTDSTDIENYTANRYGNTYFRLTSDAMEHLGEFVELAEMIHDDINVITDAINDIDDNWIRRKMVESFITVVSCITRRTRQQVAASDKVLLNEYRHFVGLRMIR